MLNHLNDKTHIIHCATANRPSAPATGQHIYDTDLDKLMRYDGADWVEAGGSGGGIETGTSFPASTTQGAMFYKTDIKTLFQYEGAWKAIISYGDVNLYVDGTLGSNTSGKGYGVGVDACATIQYAINLIPPINGGNVTVNITAGTYLEDIVIRGKAFTGNYIIKLLGTQDTPLVTGTASGAGADTDTCYLDDTTKAWTTDDYLGCFVEITSGTGVGTRRIIESNTSTKLRIVGPWSATPTGTSQYKIFNNATKVNSILIETGQIGITLDTIDIIGTVATPLSVRSFAYTIAQFCRIINTTFTGVNNGGGYCYMLACYIRSGNRCLFSEAPGATTAAGYCWFRSAGVVNSTIPAVCTVWSTAKFYPFQGTVISDGASHGVQAATNAVVQFWSNSAVGQRTRVLRNGGWGVQATTGGQTLFSSINYYSGNASGNATGDAASFGYIG